MAVSFVTKNIRIMDHRVKDKFWADDKYLNGYAKECGIYATGVYMLMCRHANRDQETWPSELFIAKQLGVSKDSVMKGIKTLVEYGIIEKRKQIKDTRGLWKSNFYVLMDKLFWKVLDGVADSNSVDASVFDKRDGSQPPDGVAHSHSKVLISEKVLENTDTEPSVPEVFSLKGELGRLKTDRRRHIQLIGEYLEEVGFVCDSKEALVVVIKRHLRDAIALSKFSDSDIGRATVHARKNYDQYTLGTLIKIISSNLYAKN